MEPVTHLLTGATLGYEVNNLDKYTSVGGGAYGYDADGNMTSAGASTYSYDDENRLIAVSGPTGSWSYQYDALGNRVAQINGSTTTQFLVDPTGMGSVVAEFGGGGNLVNHFAYGLGLTSSLPASGSAQFYQFDGSANTVAVTGTGGAVLDTYRYLPFGEKVGTGSVPNPFTYAGQFGISDDGNGLYYMRARYYDPTIGRFISEDPIRFKGGVDFYAYVGNNPLNFTDPTGLATYVTNRQLGGNTAEPWWDPATHTFTFSTNPDGTISATYSWGNAANLTGWNLNQPEDLTAAAQALQNGDAMLVAPGSMDQYYRQAFNQLNNPANNHTNLIVGRNCKTETAKLGALANKLAAQQ